MSPAAVGELTKLVIPMDGRTDSVRSVSVARRLADGLGIGIALFSLADDVPGRTAWLRSIADVHFPRREVDVAVAASGDPADAIVTAAGEAGLVCMATAASLRPHQGHIGSVAEGVVRTMGRPVVLVGPQVEPQSISAIERVIVPVDGSALSEAALDVAADLSGRLGVVPWIVTVVAHKTEVRAETQLGGGPMGAETGYVSHLAKDLGRRSGLDVAYEVLHWDDPADGIVDFTAEGDLVVMSTHGRSGLSRLFGGSVATGAVAKAKGPVVVWRPDEA